MPHYGHEVIIDVLVLVYSLVVQTKFWPTGQVKNIGYGRHCCANERAPVLVRMVAASMSRKRRHARHEEQSGLDWTRCSLITEETFFCLFDSLGLPWSLKGLGEFQILPQFQAEQNHCTNRSPSHLRNPKSASATAFCGQTDGLTYDVKLLVKLLIDSFN